MLRELIFVGTGGFLGASARYYLSCLPALQDPFRGLPYATFAINILGCFAIGLVTALTDKIAVADEFRAFLIPGLLGGFTTYSAFAFETYSLASTDRFLLALGYIILTIILGILAVMLGRALI